MICRVCTMPLAPVDKERRRRTCASCTNAVSKSRSCGSVPLGSTNRRWCCVCGLFFETRQAAARMRMCCSDRCVQRAWTLRCAYGISPLEFFKMYDAQGGLCAMPGCFSLLRLDEASRDCAVDHCHATGVVRGLLCLPCNTGLGQFEKLDRLGASTYLRDAMERSFDAA